MLLERASNNLLSIRYLWRKASDYAAEDADITFRCYSHLKPALAKTPSLEKVLHEIELPLVPVLSDMEQAGDFSKRRGL